MDNREGTYLPVDGEPIEFSVLGGPFGTKTMNGVVQRVHGPFFIEVLGEDGNRYDMHMVDIHGPRLGQVTLQLGFCPVCYENAVVNEDGMMACMACGAKWTTENYDKALADFEDKLNIQGF